MNANPMVTIAEHTIDPSLLPDGARILDIGCRGFEFVNALASAGYAVNAIDIDKFDRIDYDRVAILDRNGRIGIEWTHDPQAMHVVDGDEIECMTLAEYSRRRNVEMWDLIKMDIEGAEYKVIMSLEKAPAKQLSIEFHLHTGIYGNIEMVMMTDKLRSLGYTAVSHEYEARHCAGYNYWDSLFILK
jgi:FkbM family methyltransferase